MPLALGFGTSLDYGRLAAAVLGLVLFASALTAIGVLASAWAPQPALAAAAAFAITSLLAIVDAGARLQGIDNTGINYLALPTHAEPFFRGLVASVDIVYFVLIATLALAFATGKLDTLRSAAD
jgi:ABC-2 type transport system permease protein